MIIRLLKRFGAFKASLVFIPIAVLISNLFYFVIASLEEIYSFSGFFIATVIPAIAIPLISYYLSSLLHELDLTKEDFLIEKDSLQCLFENPFEGVSLVDRDRKILRINRHFSQLFGYSPEEALGRDIGDLIFPENSEGELDRLTKKTGNGEIIWIETVRRHKNGTLIDVIISLTPLMINKEYVGTYAIFRDITEKKKYLNTIEDREKRYRTLFNSGEDAIFVAEFKKGSRSSIFSDVNDVACKRYGYSREEFLKMAVADLDADGTVFNRLRIYEKLSTEGSMAFSTYHVAKDGTRLPVHLNCYVVELGGKSFVYVISRDMTESKKTEDEKETLQNRLIHMQKMEAIGTLAGGIAHDFNNILSGILGFTELALMDIKPDSSAHNSLGNVLNAGIRAKELVEQILTFSRQEKQEFKPTRISLIVKEVLKLLRSTFPSTIKIVRNIESDSTVMGDPIGIHQVVMNLCTNAKHAMEDKGGILSVGLKDISIEEKNAASHPELSAGTYIELTVQDSGKGIKPDILNLIFDPFFTTKEPGKGTGLGLSMVHGIVKSYGGAIEVESSFENGTAFHVLFPVVEDRENTEADVNVTLETGNEHVLLVDDEIFQVDLGKQVLEKLGYRVTTRTNSVEALDLFKKDPNRFDLVITDMTMPNMTGKDLAKELISIRHDIPIIICSGFSEHLDAESAKEIGIGAFILKPIVMREMASKVRDVLDKNGER